VDHTDPGTSITNDKRGHGNICASICRDSSARPKKWKHVNRDEMGCDSLARGDVSLKWEGRGRATGMKRQAMVSEDGGKAPNVWRHNKSNKDANERGGGAPARAHRQPDSQLPCHPKLL
jgi:hypothetical protein